MDWFTRAATRELLRPSLGKSAGPGNSPKTGKAGVLEKLGFLANQKTEADERHPLKAPYTTAAGH